jgi:hypothetical protein
VREDGHVISRIQAAAAGIVILLAVAGIGAVWGLSSALQSSWDENSELASELEGARTLLSAERDRHSRTLDALAAERALADIRRASVQTARDAILAAPPSEDGPVARVVLRAMEAADQIGGVP